MRMPAARGTSTAARVVGLASVVAMLGCAVCCAAPFVGALGLTGGLLSAFAAVFHRDAEFAVAGSLFAATVSTVALFRVLRRAKCRSPIACDATVACCKPNASGAAALISGSQSDSTTGDTP
jgi:hypothetical protein